MKHILSILLAALLLFTSTYAHPGGTDGQGGHINHSTGEYHFHHGYPAHQHPNGTCIYEFDDKTGQNSGTPGGGGYKTTQKATTTATTKAATTATTRSTTTAIQPQKQSPIGQFIENILAHVFLLYIYGITLFSVILLIHISIKMHIETKQKKRLEEQRRIAAENLRHERAAQRYDFLHEHFTDEELRKINLKLIPDDITFSPSGLPIKGEATKHEPFGFYTVYFSAKGKCFHYNPSCVKEYSSTHLFIALKYYSPCSRCVKWYHEKGIPDWYLPIFELLNNQTST